MRCWASHRENLHGPNLAEPEAACDILLWKLAVGVGLTSVETHSLSIIAKQMF